MTYLGTTPANVELEMTRGDKVTITFTHNLSTTSFDEVRFFVRNKIDGDIVLALTLTGHSSQWAFPGANTAQLTINAGDTDGKTAGHHVYDVEFSPTGGTQPVTTQSGTFILNGDVSNDGGGGAMAGLLDEQLIAWTHATAFAFTVPVYDATWPDTVASSAVVWPDGSGGTFTATSINPYCGLVDAFTVTHTDSSKTVTQTAVTRDADNRITAQPAPTVS